MQPRESNGNASDDQEDNVEQMVNGLILWEISTLKYRCSSILYPKLSKTSTF